MFGIKGFARGIAKAQLRSFLAYRSAHPDMKPEELYLAALKTRGRYSEELILGWIKDARNFQDVVICLAEYEYLMNSTLNPKLPEYDQKTRDKIQEAVRRTIPSNI